MNEPVIVHCVAQRNNVVLPMPNTDEKFVVNALNPVVVTDPDGYTNIVLRPGERCRFEVVDARWWEFWKPARYWKATMETPRVRCA